MTWWHKGLDRVELHEKLVELQEIQETFNKGWSPENSTPPKKRHPPKKQPKLAYFLHQGFSNPMFRLNPPQSTSQIILIGLISYSKYSINCPIGSMYALYRVTFTINIPQMFAYIPYMDPMGIYIYTALSENRVLPTFMLSHHFTWLRTRFPVRGLSAFGIDKIPNSRWLLVQPPKYSSTNQPKNHSSNMFKNHFNPSEKWWS